MKLAVYHSGGCGKVGFYILHRAPNSGDLLTAENCLLVDGTKPTPEQPVLCGSCGEQFMYLPKITEVEEVSCQA